MSLHSRPLAVEGVVSRSFQLDLASGQLRLCASGCGIATVLDCSAENGRPQAKHIALKKEVESIQKVNVEGEDRAGGVMESRDPSAEAESGLEGLANEVTDFATASRTEACALKLVVRSCNFKVDLGPQSVIPGFQVA